MAIAAVRAEVIAMSTPDEKTGSRNAAASPTITKRSPARRDVEYEKSLSVRTAQTRVARLILEASAGVARMRSIK